MKTHDIFRKVGTILTEINEQYQYLSESPEKLNGLELELLSANADFLAEHIKVLKKLNPQPVVSNVEEKFNAVAQSDEYKESVSVPEIKNSEHLIKQELPESYASFRKPVENELHAAQDAIEESHEDLRFPEPDGHPESVNVTEVVEPIKETSPFNTFFIPEASPVHKPAADIQAVSSNPQVEEIVADQDKPKAEEIPDKPEKVPTINEMMSAARSQNEDVKVSKAQPVSDLKSIINLNDKLLFIKELFNGYSLAYSEAIEIINRFDSFESADNFLKTNYSVKNNWASKQSAADKFYELLRRRFIR